MKNLLLVLFGLFLTAAPATAQTIIDLEKGGKVRAKTIDDYKAEARMAEIARRDSVAYVGLVRTGFTSLAADSLNEAEENLKRAIKLRPDAPGNHVLRYNLALIEMARGESKKAEKTLTDILKKHPDYVDARLARGEAYLQNGKDAEAVEDAKKVLESDEKISREMKARAHFVCAAGYYAAHRFVEAKSELLQNLRLRPDNVNARLLEALILLQMGQSVESLNRLNAIVSANPDHLDALRTRAEVQTQLNMLQPAKGDYDRLIELCPNDASLFVERARVLITLGEKRAAARDLDKAVELGMPTGMVQSLRMLVR